MPNLTWTPTGASGRDEPCTLLAVHASMRTGADLSPFRSWIRRLEPELVAAGDLLGYACRLTAEDLLVVSAWRRRASMSSFDRSPAHTRAKVELRPLLRPAVLAVWTTTAGALPPAPDDVLARIHAAGRRSPSSTPPRLVTSPPHQPRTIRERPQP